MNYYEHHIGDYIKDTAHLSMLEDAAYRRLIDAYYTKELPLPADRKACHRLARATSKSERDAVDTVLGEFFTLEDDGWHQSRCDEELAKYNEKRPAAEEKRENDKERQRRARDRRKQLFEELSRHNINMPWNATTEALQAELSRVTGVDLSQPVTEPITRDNTATHTPITSHQLNTPHTPRGGKSSVEFKTFLADCKARGEKAIADYRPVFAYAEQVKLPMDFVQLAWLEFGRQFGEGGTKQAKRQKDWRQTFRNYVEKNYLKLWWLTGEGNYELTTVGKQAERANAERLVA